MVMLCGCRLGGRQFSGCMVGVGLLGQFVRGLELVSLRTSFRIVRLGCAGIVALGFMPSVAEVRGSSGSVVQTSGLCYECVDHADMSTLKAQTHALNNGSLNLKPTSPSLPRSLNHSPTLTQITYL